MHDSLVTTKSASSIPILSITKSTLNARLKRLAQHHATWLKTSEFAAKPGDVALVPEKDGTLGLVALGLGRHERIWDFAALPGRLPKGTYYFADPFADGGNATQAALGWALACYRYNKYKKAKPAAARLVWPKGCDRRYVEFTTEAFALGRDLITTPAADMGPADLARAARQLARRHKAQFKVIVGDELLQRNYPAIHAVGRASDEEPRLIDLRWGRAKAKKLTLVGKGVCFDSGGLDLKSASGMKLMKKDMGGAATVLALAHMLMSARLDVRLRVLIPAVENSIAGNAYHPLDVLRTRKGLTVEVGNTDAEGRLILCDALAEADSEQPDLLIDIATLTGAARVALGADLPALFANNNDVAAAMIRASDENADPMWRLPLFRPYRRHLRSTVADLNNMSKVDVGGAITAALFLREFVAPKTPWVHIDSAAYNSSSRPGRPEGGEVWCARALFAYLLQRYGKR
jgi:leucyl aminopeptidase